MAKSDFSYIPWDGIEQVPRVAFDCGTEPWQQALNEWFENGIAHSFARGNWHWGYFCGETLAGFSCLGKSNWRGVGELFLIPALAVSSKFQGRGLGKQIIEHLIAESILRAPPQSAGLAVNASNIKARNLYERYGFKPFGELRGKNNDQQYMLLSLTTYRAP